MESTFRSFLPSARALTAVAAVATTLAMSPCNSYRSIGPSAAAAVLPEGRSSDSEGPSQPSRAAGAAHRGPRPSLRQRGAGYRQVGDPTGNYQNVEFTADGRFMVWFEGSQDNPNQGWVWHCALDPVTGELDPADGRGFQAFASTSWGRANPGADRSGVYYVGMDVRGRLVLVRPHGPRQGTITVLPTPAEPKRRTVYPTTLPDREGGYVLFILNDLSPGPGQRPFNTTATLQVIDLAAPAVISTVETQTIPPRGFAPMDTGFVRWMRNRTVLTYGAVLHPGGPVETRAFDASTPYFPPQNIIVDGHTKVDPFGFVHGSSEYVLTGIDATAASHIYRRPAGSPVGTPFQLAAVVAPPPTTLANPALAQSHEPFVVNGRLYSVYQINNLGTDFYDTTMRQPGELWVVDVENPHNPQRLLATPQGRPVAEPEPVLGLPNAWVFFSSPREESLPAVASFPAAWRTRAGIGGSREVQIPRFALYRTPFAGSTTLAAGPDTLTHALVPPRRIKPLSAQD